MKTAITNGQVVVYEQGGHRVANGATVIIENDRIAEIRHDGAEIAGVDRTIDARGRLVIPGLINLHAHAGIQGNAIYALDWARRDAYSSQYMAYQPTLGRRAQLSAEETRISLLSSLVNLLRNGTTTVMEMGAIGTSAEMFADLAGEIGIRAYAAFGYRSAEYGYDDEGRLIYHWDEEKGRRDFRRALDFVARYRDAYGGRVRGYLEPRNADTLTPELFRESAAAASDLGVPVQIHTAQSLIEFQEVVRRHQKTPVQFLHSLGLLGPGTILGHCVYTTGHSATAWPGNRDLEILAETSTSVAHCPLVFMRNGRALESFARYRRHGVNLGIGTDTFPQDMINEMRLALFACKLIEGDYAAASAWDVFNAATLGGARALNRDDLGRLAPGAQADLVIVNLHRLRTGPYADPVKILLHVATGQDVETVIVAGRVVVEKGQIQTMAVDEEQMVEQTQRVAEKMWAESDWPGKATIHQGGAAPQAG